MVSYINFTGIHQKFQYIIFFVKCFVMASNLDIFVRYTALFITLNLVIVSSIDFYKTTSKVWIHYNSLFSKKYAEKFFNIYLRLEELLFTRRITIIFHTDFTGVHQNPK